LLKIHIRVSRGLSSSPDKTQAHIYVYAHHRGSTGSQSASPSTCVQKLARQKIRVSSYETIEKISFLRADPQTGSGSHRFDGGICSRRRDLPYGEKIAPIGSEVAKILRVKEIRLAPPSGQTGTDSHRWSRNSVGGTATTMPGSMATVGLQRAPHDVTEFFMTTH